MNNLKILRFKMELTQYDLMAKSGISQTLLWQFEKEYRKPKPYQAEKIAAALGCTVGEVFPELEPESVGV